MKKLFNKIVAKLVKEGGFGRFWFSHRILGVLG